MSFTQPRRIVPSFPEKDVADMLKLLELSPFPERAPIPSNTPWELGIDFEYLKRLKEQFASSWSFKNLEQRVQKFEHFTVTFDLAPGELDLHYVHATSPRADAVPLLLLHGWPGTFFDFHKVIDDLTNPNRVDLPAFHVVVPSLPGYFLSSHPRTETWDIVKSAEYIHKLMVDVLGYKKYAGQGGDWGSYILRIIGTLYPKDAPVLHFNMFRSPLKNPAQQGTLTETEKRLIARRTEFGQTGRGYVEIQSTKPFTIGIAISTSPLALLTYIGEKIYAWSDPSRLDTQDILDTVALYYLTKSFPTSVLIYQQSAGLRKQMMEDPDHWRITAKVGYSAFPYEIGGSTRAEIESVGSLVYYKDHENGGHFPALDSPAEYVEDLREFFGRHWDRD